MFRKAINHLKQYLLGRQSTLAFMVTILFWRHAKIRNLGRSTMTIEYKSDLQLELRYPPHSDFQVFKQIFIEREYDDVNRLFHQYFLSDSGLRVVDAGANIGLAALFLQHEMQVKQIVCVEPDLGNFKTLTTNMKHNPTACRYDLVNQAILGETGLNYSLEKDFRDKTDWSLRVRVTDEDNGIKSVTIGDLMKSKALEQIDILKIDVEGSESSIFGARADYDFLRSTKMVAIEIHEEIIEPKAIIEVFRSNNFFEVSARGLYYFINKSFINR